jgi:hypothetical protein
MAERDLPGSATTKTRDESSMLRDADVPGLAKDLCVLSTDFKPLEEANSNERAFSFACRYTARMAENPTSADLRVAAKNLAAAGGFNTVYAR